MILTTLVLLMLNLLAIFPNDIPAARSSTIFCRGTTGLPSRLPRARAALIMPALTRSRINPLSNSANELYRSPPIVAGAERR